jgi:FK506-binding protein 2
MKLQLLSPVSCLLFGILAFAQVAPSELVIDTTYVPTGCKEKAAKGDSVQVHYVCLAFSVYLKP